MSEIRISDYINAGCKGHRNFEFVDVDLDGDTQLFIDPCLIEGATDSWSVDSERTMRGYFDCLFDGFRRSDTLYIRRLLAHAHEQNATKLGYGNGENGRGKTAEGLYDCISGLSILVRDIPTIGLAQDIPVLVVGFAEDYMSDLITNIIHDQLNRFTEQQMSIWGCPSQGVKTYWTFDGNSNSWIQVTRPCWLHNGKEVLLVPKWVVRRRFLFKAHQYLSRIIIERMRIDREWHDMRKVDVFRNLPHDGEHWEYNTVISYTRDHPDALSEYHDRLPSYYRRAIGCMDDDDLDIAVYGCDFTQDIA